MLIVCPACASEYEIETDRLGLEGRSVRCAACRETWFVKPEAVAAETNVSATAAEADPTGAPAGIAAEAPATLPTVIDQPSPPPRRAGTRARAKAGGDGARPARAPAWRRLLKTSPALAAGLVVFVALPLALLGRASVVRAMPRSAGLFAMVGLPVNLRGIEIRDVVAFRNPAQGAKPAALVVEGDLVGISRGRVATAALEIEVRDAAEHPLHRWTMPAPRAALEPAETARFRASLPSPPLQGSRVEVRFADAGSAGRDEAKAVETKPKASAQAAAPAAAQTSAAGH